MADAEAMGFILPTGDDYIRDGDNAISANAQTAADLIERHKNKRGTIPNGSDVREYLYGADKDGQWDVKSASDCKTMVQASLPDDLKTDGGTPTGFTVYVATMGNGVNLTLKIYDVYGNAEYTTSSAPSGTIGWTQWDKTAYIKDLPEQDGPTGGNASGFKTLPLALTAGRSGGESLAPTSANVEYDVSLSTAIHISRYRFAIRDGNPRFGTSTAQSISLSNISFGGVVKLASMATLADGSITYSRWFTGDFGNLKFDYAAPQAPRYIIGGGRLNGTRRVEMPFEIWLEVEVPAGTPAIGLVGDSNSIAVNATIPMNDSWMAQYCRDKGFFPVLYGHSGDAMSTSGNPTDYKWTRWDHLDNPDVVVHANGANDLPSTEGGITLAELQSRAAAEWAVSAAKISKNIHVALIKSRASGVNNTYRLGLNNWYKAFPNPVKEWHDIAAPVTANDTGGLLPQYISSDGTHMNTAGHTAIKNALTKVMTARPGLVFDQTVGRVAKAWDFQNQREQMIYGDTGARQVKDSLAAGSAANFWIQRELNTITVSIQGLITAAGNISVYTLPTGFRPVASSVRAGVLTDGISARVASPLNTAFRMLSMPGTGVWDGSVKFTTADPWPTSLPGVAA